VLGGNGLSQPLRPPEQIAHAVAGTDVPDLFILYPMRCGAEHDPIRRVHRRAWAGGSACARALVRDGLGVAVLDRLAESAHPVVTGFWSGEFVAAWSGERPGAV